MDHFANPRNTGVIENAAGVGEMGNPVCGDMMTFYIKVKDNILEDVKFQTFGCVAAIAVSSIVSEMARGKKLEEAPQITRQSVAQALGGCPRTSCTAPTWEPTPWLWPSRITRRSITEERLLSRSRSGLKSFSHRFLIVRLIPVDCIFKKTVSRLGLVVMALMKSGEGEGRLTLSARINPPGRTRGRSLLR